MRLLAVVVLYHPGKDLTGNINSYLPQVDRLLLWDNTPGGGKEQLPLSGITHPERLEYRGCGRNVGIGTALNDAVAYAREHGYTHLLTLDQDSYFLPGVFRQRVKAYGRFVSKISCCNTIWGIRRRNTACWVRRCFRTNIRRHVLITMCAMAWCFTDSILRA